jgi:peptide/nickel transport system permease protein
VAIAAPILAPYGPTEGRLLFQFQPPSRDHPFGTDELGRDVLSRVMHGYRYSLVIALLVQAVAIPIGVVIGLAAGYLGARVDSLLMRLTDIFMAFPPIILAMAIAAALGPGVRNTTIAITVVWWPWYARLMRGEVLAIKERPFVEAARALGGGTLWIMVRHIFTNSWPAVLVLATIDVGVVILSAAGLSFVGLGARPPTPDLGAMIAHGRAHMLDYWWVVTFPGLAVALVAIAANLAGDALRDQLDPTIHR